MSNKPDQAQRTIMGKVIAEPKVTVTIGELSCLKTDLRVMEKEDLPLFAECVSNPEFRSLCQGL